MYTRSKIDTTVAESGEEDGVTLLLRFYISEV